MVTPQNKGNILEAMEESQNKVQRNQEDLSSTQKPNNIRDLHSYFNLFIGTASCDLVEILVRNISHEITPQ